MKPIQPLYRDINGTIRFRENAIVRHMLDMGFIDMNRIACLTNISQEDREQFAQLIGYSLGGFGELPYVSDETYGAAERMADNIKTVTEDQARNAELRDINARLRKNMAAMVKVAYEINDATLEEYERKR
jgi:hypothetical protein